MTDLKVVLLFFIVAVGLLNLETQFLLYFFHPESLLMM